MELPTSWVKGPTRRMSLREQMLSHSARRPHFGAFSRPESELIGRRQVPSWHLEKLSPDGLRAVSRVIEGTNFSM